MLVRMQKKQDLSFIGGGNEKRHILKDNLPVSYKAYQNLIIRYSNHETTSLPNELKTTYP